MVSFFLKGSGRMFIPRVCLPLAPLLAVLCVSPVSADRKDDPRPNFVVFLMDDVGYGDIGCFGGTRAKTPNFDRFAAQGMKFTNFYAHPV